MEAVIRKREERVAPDPSDAPKPRTERAWTLGGDLKGREAQKRRGWQEQSPGEEGMAGTTFV